MYEKFHLFCENAATKMKRKAPSGAHAGVSSVRVRCRKENLQALHEGFCGPRRRAQKGGRVEVVDAALGAAATLREEGALSPESGQGCDGAAFFRTALFAQAAASVFA